MSEIEKLASCGPNCGHPEDEHDAFDLGYGDSISDKPSNPPANYSAKLAEIYRIGYSGFTKHPVETDGGQ